MPAAHRQLASPHTVKSDDHSGVEPLLPISNRTVKRGSADDSRVSRAKVGHRQTLINSNAPQGALLFAMEPDGAKAPRNFSATDVVHDFRAIV